MRIWTRIWRFSSAGRRAADQTGVAYELAYEARVASDALRFAIKELEGELSPDDRQQTALLLLDAFDRLVRAEHHFRSAGAVSRSAVPQHSLTALEDRI